MKKTYLLIAIASVVAISFSSCKKEGCTDETATNYDEDAKDDDGSCTHGTASASEPGSYIPSFSGNYAGLIAINTISTFDAGIDGIPTVEIKIPTAVAMFSLDGGASLANAGTVKLNGEELVSQANGSYTYTPTPEQLSTGGEWGTPAYWSANGAEWESFDLSGPGVFPVIPEINSDDTIATDADFTLSVASTIFTADSVMFSIVGTSNSISVIKGASSKNHTFSAADMATLGSGFGFAQVVGLKYGNPTPFVSNSLNYYFINETVRTQSVTLQ